MKKELSPLFLALDDTDIGLCHIKATSVCDAPKTFGFKLNMDVLIKHGVGVIGDFKKRYGRPIFADIKMWNGGRTMESAIKTLAEAGADMTNLYLHAGDKLIRCALRGTEGSNLQVFGVGVLTHYTDADCLALYDRPLREMVKMFGQIAADVGMHGYILAGTCLDAVDGLELTKLVPAVRPVRFENTKANDQEQTVTPTEAFNRGAQIVVCGSPVFKSADPVVALRELLEEISVATRLSD